MPNRCLSFLASGLFVVLFAIPAWGGLGESFIKAEDELEVRRGVIHETPAARVTNPVLDKLGRGATNLLTSPLELPVTIRETKKTKGWLRASTTAPLVGLGRFSVRLASGVVDVLTFPVPVPRKALWVRRQSLLMESTARAEWVISEALATQQELYLTEPARTP